MKVMASFGGNSWSLSTGNMKEEAVKTQEAVLIERWANELNQLLFHQRR